MSASRHPIIPVAVFSLCAIGGWLAARPSASSTSAMAGSDPGKAAKTARAPAKSTLPSEVLAMLAPVRAAKDAEERLRATIQLAENIPLADIEKWLSAGWFDATGDMQDNLFTRTLLSRWQEADPGAMLTFCLKKEIRIVYEFAGEWARRDPAAALACIRQQSDHQVRNVMLSYMGETLTQGDPKLVASHIAEIHAACGPEHSYQVASMIRALAGSVPELLRAQLANWPKELQAMANNSLTSAALKKNFSGTLAELSGREDGKKSFLSAVANDETLMREISRNPAALPEGWLGQLLSGGSARYYLVRDDPMKWLDSDLAELGLDTNQSRNLRSYALSQLASKDQKKLKALITGEELEANERNNAISSLVSNMKKEEAQTWIAGLNENDRLLAEAALASASGNKEEAVTPAGLLHDLAEADRKLGWGEARAAGKWGKEQMQTLYHEFDALPADQKAVVASKFVTNDHSELPVAFSAKALSYLLANPQPAPATAAQESPESGDSYGMRRGDPLANAACNIAVNWVGEDSAAAAAWVKGLPAGEARKWAIRNMVVQWAEYEPAAARRWIATMPAGERGDLEQALQDRNGPR